MNKTINIIKKEDTIKMLLKIKEHSYQEGEIRLNNAHLKNLNKKTIYKPFKKNDLFINLSTLHDAMQPGGSRGRHHYHGLSVEEVYDVLLNLKNSIGVCPSFGSRYIILTTVIANCGYKIIAIIDTKAPLMNDRNANVNKLITFYPKDVDERKFK